MRIEELLERSKIWKIAKKKFSKIIIEEVDSNPISIYYFGLNKLAVYVPKKLSEEAKAGVLIYEIIGGISNVKNHRDHLIEAYVRTSPEEKRLIWRAAKEIFGEDLEKRLDYGYWRLFRI